MLKSLAAGSSKNVESELGLLEVLFIDNVFGLAVLIVG
jgi:hypothetical protein